MPRPLYQPHREMLAQVALTEAVLKLGDLGHRAYARSHLRIGLSHFEEAIHG